MTTIEYHQKKIDSIDDTLIMLVRERMEHVAAIRGERLAAEAPLVNRERERDVYERLWATNKVPSAYVYLIMSSVIEACKRFATDQHRVEGIRGVSTIS